MSYTQSEANWREQQEAPAIKAPKDPPPCRHFASYMTHETLLFPAQKPSMQTNLNEFNQHLTIWVNSINFHFVCQANIMFFFFFLLRRCSTFMFSLSYPRSPRKCHVEASASTWHLESLNLLLFQIYRCHFKRIAMQCFGLIVTTKRHILTEYFIDCIFIAHMYPSS